MSRNVSALFTEEATSTEQTEFVKLFTLELANTYVFGTGLLGSSQLTVTKASDFVIGQEFTIDSIEQTFTVVDVIGEVLTLSPPLPAAVNNLKDSEGEELHLLMVDDHIPAGAKLY